MGRKLVIYDYDALQGLSTDMSAASITSNSTVVSQLDSVTYLVTWSGGQATNGNIEIQASLDGVTWYALDFGATISLNGASDFARLVITEVGFNQTRAVYTRTNALATGTLSIKLFATTKGA